MLALALTLALPALAGSIRIYCDHYQSFSRATDCSDTGNRNKPNTAAARANDWTRRSHTSTPTGFVVGNVVQGRSGRLALGVGVGGRGRVSGARMAGDRWDERGFAKGWRNGVRGGWGVKKQKPRGGSSVVIGAGTGETEFYSWTETETDLEVRVALPPGTPAKNVQLSVTKTSLALGLRGREGAVLKGTLKGQVQADLSHWTMEEKEDTGEKIMYLCLEKAIDMEALEKNGMPMDWSGVLEGEEVVKVFYPKKDKDFDVNEYVKRMGYDRDRDVDKVDKTMFSGLTEEMKKNLAENLPRSSYTEKDDMIPVVSGPKVSPVIDTGVLGVQASAFPLEPGHISPANDGVGNDDGNGRGEASPSSTGDVDPGGSPRGNGEVAGDASPDIPLEPNPAVEASRPPRELTARQREVASGLRDTYKRLLGSGMFQRNPDGTSAEIPDMDELAREYEEDGFMPKDSDFSDEELRKNEAMSMSVMSGGLDDEFDFDANDPAVRAAFGLEGEKKGNGKP